MQSAVRRSPAPILQLLFVSVAFLYAPTRLIQEANPEWSLVSWALAVEAVVLTLLFLMRATALAGEGKAESRCRVSDFCFPLGFFLVAVPWPYLIEQLVIQGLTRLNAALTIEILGWCGIPSFQRGNVIELATGVVGIDEACSGIRSLQATLMLSLFFGELYRLSVLRRGLLVLTGFGLALVCNLGRTLLLTWVASRQGVGAIAGWHDPAGVTILLACFVGLWLVAGWFKKRADGANSQQVKPEPETRNVADAKAGAEAALATNGQPSEPGVPGAAGKCLSPGGGWACAGLAVWLGLVEVGVAAWYRHVDSKLQDYASWTVSWPTNAVEFKDLPIAKAATEMLRYDDARQVQWTEGGRLRWQLGWFYWKPGKAAAYLAKSHNPLICMPAAGYEVGGVSAVQHADLDSLRLPFRIYRFDQSGVTGHVLYSRWEDRAIEQSFAREGVTRWNRFRGIWTGRGNHGQRVLTLAVWGIREDDAAREVLVRQLQRLVQVEPSDPQR